MNRSHINRWLGAAAFAVLLAIAGADPAVAQEATPGSACAVNGNFIRSGGPELSGAGHFMVCSSGTWVSALSYSSTGNTLVPGALSVTGDLSPASIGGNQNDYAPTGHANASVMRLTASGAYNITGLQGGTDGRVLTLTNIGSNPITLVDESGASTAANRFDLASNVTLLDDQSAVLLYDSTSQRWRVMANYGSATASAGGSDRQMQFNNAGALGGASGFTYTAAGFLDAWLQNIDVTATEQSMARFQGEVIPASAQAAGRNTNGLYGGIHVPAGNTQQIRKVVGTFGYAQNSGTGPVETMHGILGYANNTGGGNVTDLITGYFGAEHSGSGAVQYMNGINAEALKTGTGNITDMTGIYTRTRNQNATGTVGTAYGIFIDTAVNTGTITNLYGLFQADAAAMNVITGGLQLRGDISPASIGGNQNNYAPTGHATATVMRLTASGAYNITGLQGGGDGRVVTLTNIGSNAITLVNESGSSTAANRFATGANVTMGANQSAVLIYDSSSQRWRVMANYGSATAGAGGSDRQIQFNSAGTLSGVPNFLYNADGTISLWANNTGTTNVTYRQTHFMMDVAPSAAQAAGRGNRALSGSAYVPLANASQVRGVAGIDGYAENRGTGAVEALIGSSAYSWTNNGNVGGVFGTYAGAEIDAGSATSVFGASYDTRVDGGTVNSVFGLSINNMIGGGTVTSRYGLHLATPTGSATNDWGFYQQGTQNNRFGGSLGIGVTTPATALDVNGALRVAYDSQSCAAASEGAIRYNSATDTFELCKTAGSWTNMQASAAGGANRQIQFNNAGAVGGVPNFDYRTDGTIQFYSNTTGTATGNVTGSTFMVDVLPSANQAAGRSTRGLLGMAIVPAGNTNSVQKTVGTYAYAENRGSGTVASLDGLNSYAWMNAGTITNMFGAYSGAESSGGNVGTLWGMAIDASVTGGTVGTVNGLTINMPFTSGTVTNRHGLYLQTPGGTAANDWGIYQNGTQKNRFNGSIGIKTANSSDYSLAITDSFTAQNWDTAAYIWADNNGASAAYNGFAGLTIDVTNKVTGTGGSDGRGISISANAANDGDSQLIFGGYIDIQTHANDTGYGVFVQSDLTSSAGSQTGFMAEIDDTNLTSAYGFYGTVAATNGVGVYGQATATTGTNYGVQGRSDSTSGWGVYGYASASTGSAYGVRGEADSSTGIGVSGYAGSNSGLTRGVTGWVESTTGTGVIGTAAATSGTNYGVYGTTASTAGRGVYGDASAAGGIGVYGNNANATGYGIYCNSGNTNGCGGNRAWFNASDARLKDHVILLGPDSGLEAIMQLRPVRYEWRDKASAGKVELGFIAQDVEKVLPELVGIGPDQEITLPDGSKVTIEKAKVMSYSQVTVPLVKAAQELKAENDVLQRRVEALEAANDNLRERLEKLEAASR